MDDIYVCLLKHKHTHIRGLHGPDISVRARPDLHGYNLGPAQSKEENFNPGPARPIVFQILSQKAWFK